MPRRLGRPGRMRAAGRAALGQQLVGIALLLGSAHRQFGQRQPVLLVLVRPQHRARRLRLARVVVVMIRENATPRPNWREDCEAIGFTYHSIDGTYWDESRCYRFTADEIDTLEAAAAELHARCLDAVEHIVTHDRMAELAIPRRVARARRALVAREGAVALRPLRPRLRRQGAAQAPRVQRRHADGAARGLGRAVALAGAEDPAGRRRRRPVQFAAREADRELARVRGELVGGHARAFHVRRRQRGGPRQPRLPARRGDAGRRRRRASSTSRTSAGTRPPACFVDDGNDEIRVLCKLYPWEWLADEAFGPHLLGAEPARDRARLEDAAVQQGRAADPVGALSRSREPAARVLSSAGRIPATTSRSRCSRAKAPTSRSTPAARTIAADGEYGAEGRIYQAYAPIPRFGDDYVTIGAWIVGDEPAGIGLREDASPITRNTSRFVPHYFL